MCEGKMPFDSLDFWRSFVDNVPDMLLLVDTHGNIVYVNHAPIGMSRDDMLGRDALEYVPEESRPELRKAIRNIFEGAPALLREHRGVHNDGTERWYATHTGPVKHDGKVVAVIIAARDVTERRLMERKLKEWHKYDALGKFAAGIAHDFNNILTIVATSTQFIADDTDCVDTLANATAILTETRRGAALTSQLMAFAHGEALPKGRINVNDVIREITRAVSTVITDRISIALDLEEGCAQVILNRSQLEQVVMNLVLNSRDAITGKGVIELSTRCEERAVRLRVKDNGCGMTEETQRRILEPFFTTKRNTGGTGVGLSTVHGIVKSAGGSLIIQSKPGHGTTMDIEFQRAS